MKIYENIIIGNFLFSLGYAVRSRQSSDAQCGVVNLLQQTPVDKLLGDVLLDFSGVVRLIEFKNEKNNSSKEEARHRKLSIALNHRHWEPISRSVHWYIETGARSDNLVAKIVPYLDLLDAQAKESRLEGFIENLAEEIVNSRQEFSRKAIHEYLSLVRETQGGGVVGTGDLLLLAEPNGKLYYVPMFDLMELRIKDRELIWLHEKRLERERLRQLDIDKKRGRELSIERPGLER